MSFDISFAAGFGLDADNYPLLPTDDECDEEWNEVEDSRISVEEKRTFESVEYFLIIPGDTLQEVLDNEEAFYSAILERTGEIVTREDLTLIKEAGIF